MPIISLPPSITGLTSGLSGVIAVGSGKARPGGVESIFEFNGALLNARGWYDTYVITSISGVGDPDVRDSRDVNPGRHGETYFNAYYGGRTIVLSGYIRAYSLAKLRDMQQGLKQVFADLAQEQPLYIRTGDVERDVFIYCKKSAPLVMDEAQVNFEYKREFQITLRASNPNFLSYLEERISYTSGWADLVAPGPAPPVSATNLAVNGRANVPVGGVTPGIDGWGFNVAAAPLTVISSALANVSITNANFPGGRAFNITGTTPPMAPSDPPPGGPDLAIGTFSSSGPLTGSALAVGGNWDGAGDPDDFTVSAVLGVAHRTAATDSTLNPHLGRWAIAGTATYGNVVVQVDTMWQSAYTGWAGVFARYTDTDNWLAAFLTPNSLGSNRTELVVTRRVAGVTTEMARTEFGVISPNTMHSVRLWVDAIGNVQADCFVPGTSAGTPLITTSHASLATGGALASGKVGFLNYCIGPPTLPTRTYDNFGAWTPEAAGYIPYAFFEHTLPGSAPIPIVSGETYRWTVSLVPTSHAYTAPGAVTYYLYLNFTGPGGVTSTAVAYPLVNTGGRMTITGTAPTGATGARLYVAVPLSSSKSFNLFVGDSVLTRASENPTGEFFDGETTNGLWNGTRYLSTSRKYPATGLEGLYLPDTSSEAQWYLDTDGYLKHSGGNPSVPTVRQIYRSDQTRTFTDLQATVKIRTGSVVSSGGTFGLVMKRKTGADFLYLRLLANSGTSRLQIYKFNVGVEAQLAQSATLILNANTIYWLRGRVAGNTVVLELWTTNPDTIPPGPVYASVTHTLIGTDSTDFGSGVVGGFGLRSTLDVAGMDWGWRDHDTDQIALSPTLAFNAANNGNAPAQPMIKIYGPLSAAASGGNAVRVAIPRIQLDGSVLAQQMIINAKTGSTLAIPSGNYIEVDTDKRTLKEFTSLGVFVRHSFDQLDLASDWMELDPGDNPVEVQNYTVGTSPTLEMRYRHTYF